MASKTTNYNLDMPGYDEIADIDVINGNMDKIDVQMKKNADSAQQSKDIVSDEYSATNTYAVGDYCIHENILYKCKTAITTGEAFDSNKWVQTTCGTEFRGLNSNLSELEFGEVAGGKNKVFGVSYGYINSSGNYFIDNGSTSAICYLENGKTYKISCNIKPFAENIRIGKIYSKTPENGTVDNLQQLGKGIDTFTSNFTGYAIVYTHPVKNENVINSIQIEEGTQATDYEPYIPSVKMLAEEVNQQNESFAELKNDLTPILIQKQISESDWSADGNVYRTYVTLTDDIPSNKKVLSLYQERMYKGDEQSWLGGIIVNHNDLGTKLVVFSTTKINCTLGLQVVLI